jgi:steroid 5-alpha reductase family enzyme
MNSEKLRSRSARLLIAAALLMSVLLLKVSGVALLEKDIGERRPAYADYIRRTSAFFPRRPRD